MNLCRIVVSFISWVRDVGLRQKAEWGQSGEVVGHTFLILNSLALHPCFWKI